MSAVVDEYLTLDGDSRASVNAEFAIESQANHLWAMSSRGRRITVAPRAVLRRTSKIFAMGSCFAREIRAALQAMGYDVYPKYSEIRFDPSRQKPSKLPAYDNINHYNTFSIRQEIERAIERRPFDVEDFWELHRHHLSKRGEWKRVFQDPYRKHIYAADQESTVDLSATISGTISEGLAAADVVILTLGLTECWRHRKSGLFVCMGPKTEDSEIYPFLEFHSSTYAENYDNVAAILDRIDAAYPDKTIVLTVSPVALGQTWTDQDVVVANMTSKSILRAVVAQICRERPHVMYWPSYEFALASRAFLEDGRHVTRPAVSAIVAGFLHAASLE